MISRQVRFAARPSGFPGEETWRVTEEEVPPPGEGEVLLTVRWLSVDPAMRLWLEEGPSYAPPVELGDVMRASGIGEVLESRHEAFKVGDLARGRVGIQTHANLAGSDLVKIDQVKSDQVGNDRRTAPPPVWLGALGSGGLTAHIGLLDVGQPKAGEAVVVSGAAGSVGSVAGQIARIHGCRVVGIAGGPEKCAWVTGDLGFDACIDYKAHDSVDGALREAAPDGVDVYFDNVGGDILDAVLPQLTHGARVVLCGAISQYNAEGGFVGPKNYWHLLVHRARLEGFVVSDHPDRFEAATRDLAAWRADGRLITREDVVEGTVDDFGAMLLRLYRGENTGKLILQIA